MADEQKVQRKEEGNKEVTKKAAPVINPVIKLVGVGVIIKTYKVKGTENKVERRNVR